MTVKSELVDISWQDMMAITVVGKQFKEATKNRVSASPLKQIVLGLSKLQEGTEVDIVCTHHELLSRDRLKLCRKSV